MRGGSLKLALSVGLAFAAFMSGCYWPLPGQGPNRHAHNAAESAIAPDNVASLEQAWAATLDGGPVSDPVTSNFGVLASGARSTYSLAPESGAVRWTHTVDAPLSVTQPVVRGDVVLAGRWN